MAWPDQSGTWSFGGYAEVLGTTRFYHPDLRNRDPKYRDTQLDVARVAFFVATAISRVFTFVSEIEFEHGGTGAAKEVEWDEFGEYETEVEKGGEVSLEQAYVEAKLDDRIRLRVGHLLVPIGITSAYHLPTFFSPVHRPESESHLIPEVWHETGAELSVQLDEFTVRLQMLSGLDSTGFSSNRWVAGGSQRAFEGAFSNDWAHALSVEYTGLSGALFGIGAYTSGVIGNRPKHDMPNVAARVWIADAHVRFQHGPLKLRGLALVGSLNHAAAITAANANLSSDLGMTRDAVGAAAYALSGEVAVDVFRWIPPLRKQRLDTFVRFDTYDPMWKAAADFDNPILQRRVLTAGINYFPHPRVVAKADYVSRWLNEGRQWARQQNEVNFALGIVM